MTPVASGGRRPGECAAAAVAAAVARPLQAGTAAFVVGLLVSSWVPAGLVALPCGGVVVSGSAWWARRDRRVMGIRLSSARRARLPVVLAVVAAGLVGGAAVGAARLAALEASSLQPRLGHEVAVVVVVQEAGRASPFGGWSALAELDGEPVLLRRFEPRSGDAATAAASLPEPGSELRVSGSLRRPGTFARRRHAHAELRADAIVVAGRRGGPLGALDGVRRAAEAGLDRGLPADAAGLLRGMVLGEDGALQPVTRDAFRASGLSHLVAASGTNVVLLAALATALGAAVGLGFSGRLWLTLALVVVYVPLAGGGPSIQRAGVMGAAAVAAGLVGRPASRWWALELAAAVTLVLDPRSVQDPGWQLSFAAVLAILLLAGRWGRGLAAWGVPGPLAEVTAMTGAATLATAPLVAAHFGQASLVGLPVNLLAAPAVAPVMWLGVAAAGVAQAIALGGAVAVVAGALADGLDALAGFPLGYLIWLARTGASIPGAVVQVGPVVVLACSVALAVAIGSRRGRSAAPASALACAALVVGLAPAQAGPPPPPAGFRVTALDVGQGDATLLQDGPTSVLVDTGPPEAGIVARLRRAGVRAIDVLVVTHAQADHLGAAPEVLLGVPVAMVLDGRDGVASAGGDRMAALARERRIPLVAPRAGQEVRLGGLLLRVLWPRAEPAAAHAGSDPNQRAIVLEAEAEGARVLLTADAESDVTTRLDLEHVDVLKVAHHGSADPGLPALLARLRPRVAAIEVGVHNTYGHPAPTTLAALAGLPVVVRTDRDGTVRLDHLPGGGWQVRGHA